MAGHSHSHNIMFKKNANDAKKAEIFTKMAREIQIAVKNGSSDPAYNAKLKTLIAKARTLNMSDNKISSAIAKANKDTTNYESVRYNAFFDHGVTIIIECLTNNKNRTASDVRSILNEFNVQITPTGSVEFMYSHIGRIIYPISIGNEDKMLETAVEVEAYNVYAKNDIFVFETSIEKMLPIVAALTDKLKQEPSSAEWFWKANKYIGIDDKEFLEKYQKLLNELESHDDVMNVYTNVDLEIKNPN